MRQVAETDATVLLLGETGSGKELFASQIHELSRRRGRAMVRVNCAAIPATLIESELFGREKGAYTGALTRQAGRFEIADGSTIFLDEIGDLPLDVQVKLLRVLEEKQIERLGSSRPIKIDTRIIAATHRDLEKRIEADHFREDLYYRLNVFPIRVPPLRERAEDIPLLVWRFVEEFSKAFGKRIESITKDNMEMLQRYAWPGNVRELRNLVERAVIVASGPRLTIALPAASAAAARRSVRLADVEKEHIKSVLDGTRWRIRGAGGAAEQLGLKATTLETRMAKLGLRRPRPLTPTFRAPSVDSGDTPGAGQCRRAPRRTADNSKRHRHIAPLPRPSAVLVRLLLFARAWCAWLLLSLLPGRGPTEVVHALRLLASPTRVEPGCLGCRVWTEESDDEGTVRYVEEWATEDAMRLRVSSERFTRLLEVLEAASSPPSVQFDFVSETRGLDYVAEVRARLA